MSLGKEPRTQRAGPPYLRFQWKNSGGLDALREPRSKRSFVEAHHVAPAQAKAWLKRAVAEGKVRKVGKHVRYVAVSDSMPLFTAKSKA
jgi:hypothetical protein